MNILSLYGKSYPFKYNTCRNLEWQVCAAKGALHGQGGRGEMLFALAPGALEPWTGERPIGSCTGYQPAGCGSQGYASSDIFYLEVCILSAMCRNRHELFLLPAGKRWACDLDYGGFSRLQDQVLGGLQG